MLENITIPRTNSKIYAIFGHFFCYFQGYYEKSQRLKCHFFWHDRAARIPNTYYKKKYPFNNKKSKGHTTPCGIVKYFPRFIVTPIPYVDFFLIGLGNVIIPYMKKSNDSKLLLR